MVYNPIYYKSNIVCSDDFRFTKKFSDLVSDENDILLTEGVRYSSFPTYLDRLIR